MSTGAWIALTVLAFSLGIMGGFTVVTVLTSKVIARDHLENMAEIEDRLGKGIPA